MSPRETRLRERIDALTDELYRTRIISDDRRRRLTRANERLRDAQRSRDRWKAAARGC